MHLLNLSLAQYLAVFGSIAAVSVALYLLDRSRRKIVVSTLRFWVAAEQPAVAARRRHINQPWSLILQLVSMALLLLAIAQLQFGGAQVAGRDDVIVLETSAWMGARSGNRTLMDTARQRARQYLRALPAGDRVMLVRADALATPATAFEPDRKRIADAIDASQPGSTALNLDQALAFARHVQGQDGRRVGEIAFIGAGRTAERDPGSAPQPPHNLRVIPIADTVENCGLRRIGLRRSGSDPDVWDVFVSARNYGATAHPVTLSLNFGPPQAETRTSVGTQRLDLKPGEDGEASFEFRATGAGILGVTLAPHDAFPADDHAELELPATPMLAVTVYSNEPDLLKPMLSAAPRVTASYRKPSEFRASDQGLVILDRFIPPQRPAGDSIWIDPPAQGSPVPVRATVQNVAFAGWDAADPLAAGLRARDFKLDKASVFEAAPGDIKIGSVDSGPVIVARAGSPKVVVMGFHPALSPLKYELTTPLLFANMLKWVSPEIFRSWEINGGSVGTVKLVLDDDQAAKNVKVTAADGQPLPFTVHDRILHFFAGTAGAVRVQAGDHEYMYSLTLPQLWDAKWTPPASARTGIPHFAPIFDSTTESWPWLAFAGGLGLLAEWLLYGRFRRSREVRPVILRREARRAAEVRR